MSDKTKKYVKCGAMVVLLTAAITQAVATTIIAANFHEVLKVIRLIAPQLGV